MTTKQLNNKNIGKNDVEIIDFNKGNSIAFSAIVFFDFGM